MQLNHDLGRVTYTELGYTVEKPDMFFVSFHPRITWGSSPTRFSFFVGRLQSLLAIRFQWLLRESGESSYAARNTCICASLDHIPSVTRHSYLYLNRGYANSTTLAAVVSLPRMSAAQRRSWAPGKVVW